MSTKGILFDPIKINQLELKNRIVFPPMVTGHSKPDCKGRVTDAHVRWYETRARGGAGLIIVEFTSVAPSGTPGPVTLAIYEDETIPGYRKLTDAVHAAGAKIFLQLSHAGRQTEKAFTGGAYTVAPSAISCPLRGDQTHETPKPLSIDEIEEIIDQFGTAAGRAKAAGFDGVEVHGGHGYLISAFMSAYSNKRHDEYGGDLHGRMQFPIKIVQRIRKEVGDGFPISFRMSGNEYVPDGRTTEESRRVGAILEKAGVDCLHITAGVYESFWSQIPAHGTREGINSDDSAAIKTAVTIPVITVGRIKSPDLAEDLLQEGKADLVAIGRQLICDPEWPEKVAAGNFEDIRPCIGCTQSCINRGMIQGQPTACLYNTSAGMEEESRFSKTDTPKQVLIVGGGPAGLEAARIAALRGHQVRLVEKSYELGGRFNLACIPPFKQEFSTVIKWYETQIRKLGVVVDLSKTVTPEFVDSIQPEVVIVATGAVNQIPPIPGIDHQRVIFGDELLAGHAMPGHNVLIVGGGGIGTETADFVAQREKAVTIVEMLPEIGIPTGIPLLITQTLLPRLKQYGVKMLTNTRVKEITHDAVIVEIDGTEETIRDIDQVILATGARSVNDLAGALEGRVPELYTIGDAKSPRTAFEATHEGAEIARRI